MKKIKYFYNTNTLRYEKLSTPFRVRLLRFFGFLSALIVSSTIVIYLYTKFGPKPKNAESIKLEIVKENYKILKDKVGSLEEQVATLEKRDNDVYRSIFEQNPLPDSARAKLIEKQKEVEKISGISDEDK